MSEKEGDKKIESMKFESFPVGERLEVVDKFSSGKVSESVNKIINEISGEDFKAIIDWLEAQNTEEEKIKYLKYEFESLSFRSKIKLLEELTERLQIDVNALIKEKENLEK